MELDQQRIGAQVIGAYAQGLFEALDGLVLEAVLGEHLGLGDQVLLALGLALHAEGGGRASSTGWARRPGAALRGERLPAGQLAVELQLEFHGRLGLRLGRGRRGLLEGERRFEVVQIELQLDLLRLRRPASDGGGRLLRPGGTARRFQEIGGGFTRLVGSSSSSGRSISNMSSRLSSISPLSSSSTSTTASASPPPTAAAASAMARERSSSIERSISSSSSISMGRCGALRAGFRGGARLRHLHLGLLGARNGRLLAGADHARHALGLRVALHGDGEEVGGAGGVPRLAQLEDGVGDEADVLGVDVQRPLVDLGRVLRRGRG